MDPVEIISNFSDFTAERLTEYITSLRAAFDELVALDSPTADQVAQAERYADAIDAATTEQSGRVQAAADLASRHEALRTRFPDGHDVEPDADVDDTAPRRGRSRMAEEDTVTAASETPEPEQEPAPSNVAVLATRTTRPPAPVATQRPVTITASADVPEFVTGARLPDLTAVGQAVINRMRGFTPPTGDGSKEELHMYGVASFALDFPEELTTARGTDDQEVLTRAADERRLPGGSLTAAGGWCAPSQTLYDLCVAETTDGMVSIPEVAVTRGGIRFTKGPDFSDIYTNTGFCLTEAQVMAGTAKTCYEVPCPPFTEKRLDACGVCIKAPLLTNAAYPELVSRWISGSLIAHQHQINAKVLNEMEAYLGPAVAVRDYGGTFIDSVGMLELIGDSIRNHYRMGLRQTLEVVAPFWLQGAIQNDLANRAGFAIAPEQITDDYINRQFAARIMNIQWVYDWQDLGEEAVGGGTPGAMCPTDYPATAKIMVYPAGTFVKGTAPVINLSAVYDSASLQQNLYTAVFAEQGVLVANMCYDGCLVEVPVCNAGQQGALNVACA